MAVDSPSPTWYRTRRGWALALSYAAVVVAAALASTETANLLDAVQTIPGVVYLFGAFGVLLWGLAAIVRQGDAPTDGDATPEPTGDGRGLLAGEARELVLRPFAALPLAAGVYLLSGVVAGSAAGPSTTATAVLALFAGLYLHRTYDRLGRIADTLRREDRDDDPAPSDATPWYRRLRGALLVGVYLVAALGVLAVTVETSPLARELVPEAVRVPAGIYLYGLLGVMGRIFTELIREAHVPAETLAVRALRIPMAMLLAGAVSLVVALPSSSASFTVAGLAFLVGLYEGVGFHYLAVAGRRLLPTAGETPSGGTAGGGTDE